MPPAPFSSFTLVAASNDSRHRLARTRDAGAHAASLGHWHQAYEQLTAGGFAGELEELELGPVQIFREQANQALLQSGRPRPGTVTLGLLRGPGPANWYCGRRLNDDGILTATDDDFELIAGGPMCLTAVCIDRDHLQTLAQSLGGPDLDSNGLDPISCPYPYPYPYPFSGSGSGPGLPVRRRPDPAVFEPLVNEAFGLVRARPGLLDHAAATQMLTLSLSELVLEQIAPLGEDDRPPPPAGIRHRIVSRARDYMGAHAAEAITVPDLCAATGVSRRALQYAFEDVLQLSPVTYLRVMRLNRVRADLLACPRETVGDVAARWGFWHLSRFAADYRQLFGELPSATRARLAEFG